MIAPLVKREPVLIRIRMADKAFNALAMFFAALAGKKPSWLRRFDEEIHGRSRPSDEGERKLKPVWQGLTSLILHSRVAR